MAEPRAALAAEAAACGHDALLATKLHLPRPRPGFVPRPRLAARLDEGRARAALQGRLPAGRDHAPVPGSPRERHLAGRFAAAVEAGDIDAVLTLLTSDAWLTMPPEPYQYQGPAAIAAFLRHRAALRGAPLRLVPTRANTQPAFGCYLPCAQTPLARPYGMIVLTLTGDQISAITWFSDSSVFPHFGLPRALPR